MGNDEMKNLKAAPKIKTFPMQVLSKMKPNVVPMGCAQHLRNITNTIESTISKTNIIIYDSRKTYFL